ncbi:hypothetical protein E1B28_009865 [Marasmius oreades]|uniref:Uncharacterized protein n=1 Tax=Marasmius oreades TaxID=181124 RepID=A0A9P7RW63_9AGAR|nr:uncharacterized protein E1B28_009865 [Marasmius oreades]KAG7090780.1 hypothetical protein E1B28_009865 [Marasmius oreades]
MGSVLEDYYPSPPSSNQPSPQITPESIRQLDLAYQRVRQLRRDILHSYTSRGRDNSMGPPHEALLLGGQGGGNEHQNTDTPPLQRLRSPVSSETMERLRQFETLQAELDSSRSLHSLQLTTNHDETSSQSPSDLESTRPSQPPLLRLQPSSLHLPPSPISPISPPRQPLLPPRVLEPSHTPRWTTISDDPHTLLGRRVAAVMRTVENRTSTTAQIPDANAESARRMSQQDSDHSVNSRHPLPPSFREGHRTEMDARSPTPLRTGPRRARTIRGDTRQNSGSRLSTLSNFSVQNLPTPTTTHSQSLILFDEPTSYEPGPETSHTPLETERMESIDEEIPQRPRDHLNEHVRGLGLSMDWDFASRRGSSFFETNVDPEHHQRRVIRYSEDVVPLTNVIRLDADGDEIPVEDGVHGQEASHWPRWIHNPVEDLQSNYHHHHHTTTLTRPGHIVILPDGREEIWPSVPTALARSHIGPKITGKWTPFSPDPLPLPLPDETTTRSPGVLVSREACLVAR